MVIQKLLITIKHRGGDTKQRREFSVFWDKNLEQETTLTTDGGGVIGLIL